MFKMLTVISFFVFATVFVPVFGVIFLFLLPAVMFFNGAVHGATKTSAAFLIAFSLLLFLAVLLDLNVPVMGIFTLSVAGLLMLNVVTQNGSVEKTIIYPSLLLISAVCFYFIYDAFAVSLHPWELVKNYVADAIRENVKIYKTLPLKAEDIAFVVDNEKNIIQGLTQIFPATVIIASAFIIWVNFLLGKKLLIPRGLIRPRLIFLAGWKAPDSMIWIFILSGVLSLMPHKSLNFIGINIFLAVCFVYLLQGLAIVSFLFQSKNVPLFFRTIFYFLIAVQQILVIPIGAIGLFNTWFDFRKFFQKDNKEA